MLCLLVPLLVSLIFAVILIVTSTSISLKTDDILQIIGIVLASIAYLSVFYLIGMLISAITHRTSTALMMSMFVWGFLVLAYPNMVIAVINPSETSRSQTGSVYNHIKQTWEEFDRDRKHFLVTDAVPGEDPAFGMDGPSGWGGGDGFIENQSTLLYYYWSVLFFNDFYDNHLPRVQHAQNYYGFLGPQIIRTADRMWLVRKSAFDDIFVQPASVANNLLKLSPVGLYDAATQAWAGTDLNGVQDFFQAVRQYRREVIAYLYDREAFRSREWFASDQQRADWSMLPQFSFQRSEVAINAKRAFPDLFLLIIANVAMFVIIFLIFIKTEV